LPSDLRTNTTLLDRVLGPTETDATLARRRVIAAPAATTYAAARHLDFMTVHSPLMDAAMFVRGIPNRLRRVEEPAPARMVLGEPDGLPGWSVLAEDPDREVVFGAVGVFWTPSITWRDSMTLDEFRAFHESGWGKIACSLRVDALDARHSELTYECRTCVTDPVSRRKFLRYWRLIRPFVGHILGATVTTVGRNIESPTKAASS
jgi:hypothetical protein